jgi:sporulation protein YlmC with PRC-barrel domain
MKNKQPVSVASAMAVLCAFTAPFAFAQSPTSSMKKAPCVCLASDLVGTKVVSQTNEKLGKIEDVVVHPDGEVAYAVLSFGGTLGLGDKLFAIPWNSVQFKGFEMADKAAKEPKDPKDAKEPKDSERAIVLSIDKERLKNAPGFDKNNWPVMASPEWAKDVDAYYSSMGKSDTVKPVEAGAQKKGVIWRCSELKGFNVNTPTDEKLGDIKEVAIDTNGRVSYVVISVGGFLGMGDRHVAVPWDALKIAREGEKGDKKKVILPTTKERLKEAPEFKEPKDKSSEMCDPVWIGKVYDYYSIRPYWAKSDMAEPKQKN